MPYENAPRIYHTNHAIANDDRVRAADDLVASIEPCDRTKARYDFLTRRLGDASRSVDINIVKAVLTSHEVPTCFHKTHEPGSHTTVASIIMSLSNAPELYLALQPPCQMAWQRFTF